MAKKQTRRTVSLSRATYDTATEAAARAGMATSEWVTNLIRGACPELPPQAHARALAAGEQRLVVHVPNATTELPRPSRLELDQLAAKRRMAGIAPGTLCANCVEHKATHRGRVDVGGPLYPLCDACELPDAADEEPDRPRSIVRANLGDAIADALGEP